MAVYVQPSLAKPSVRLIKKPGSSPAAAYLTPQQTLQLLTLTVQHAYIQCGNHTYLQTRGIPMGASYSPVLCNLYLLTYELAAFKKHLYLVSCYQFKLRLISEWKLYMRYIDDIRLVNAPTLSNWIINPVHQGLTDSFKWIYPACVTIEITGSFPDNQSHQSSTSPSPIHYLDLTTLIARDGSYSLDIYSKEDKQCKSLELWHGS